MNPVYASRSKLTLLEKFYKYLTILIFFILPSRISYIFTSLSIVSIIFYLRGKSIDLDNIDKERIKEFLHITLKQEVILLPNYTLHWFWDKEFLEKQITIDGKKVTIKEAVKDDEIFNHHKQYIIELFVNYLPKLLKLKLHLNTKLEHIRFKNNIIRTILYV